MEFLSIIQSGLHLFLVMRWICVIIYLMRVSWLSLYAFQIFYVTFGTLGDLLCSVMAVCLELDSLICSGVCVGDFIIVIGIDVSACLSWCTWYPGNKAILW